jgi:hypothetical protein
MPAKSTKAAKTRNSGATAKAAGKGRAASGFSGRHVAQISANRLDRARKSGRPANQNND